jgi:hypothetical protein
MLQSQIFPKWPLNDPSDEARRIDIRQEIEAEAQRMFIPSGERMNVMVVKVINKCI